MHGTTDPEALNDGTLTRREYPPIQRQPRTPVKWTVRTVGQPTITAETLAGLATYQHNGHNGNGSK